MTQENGKEQLVREKREEDIISSKVLSFYLIWSVLISLGVIIIGTLEFIITGSTGYQRVPILILLQSGGHLTVVFPHTLGTIVFGVFRVKSFAIIQLGLLLLILSPLGRIFIQILIYVKEKDRTFVYIATAVFIILLFSLYLSKFIA